MKRGCYRAEMRLFRYLAENTGVAQGPVTIAGKRLGATLRVSLEQSRWQHSHHTRLSSTWACTSLI